MSRSKQPIQTKSYLSLAPDGEDRVCLSDLNYSQKDDLGACLQAEFLSAFYAGKFRFWVESMSPIEQCQQHNKKGGQLQWVDIVL